MSNGDVVEVVGQRGDFMELKNGGWIRSKNLASVRAPLPGLDAHVKSDDAPVKAVFFHRTSHILLKPFSPHRRNLERHQGTSGSFFRLCYCVVVREGTCGNL